MTKNISDLLGPQNASDNELSHSMRHHQSWWRAFVLNEEEGLHPTKGIEGVTIGSTIQNGTQSKHNFINEDAIKAVRESLESRGLNMDSEEINETQLYDNLLSTQTLSVNFFGTLKYNLSLATQFIKGFYPDVKKVTNVLFEFAPNISSKNDDSAHNIALEFVTEEGLKGLIGLECKYTEPFSTKVYDKTEYKSIYKQCNAFKASYEDMKQSRYNQLFRNQLVAQSAKLTGAYDIVYTGLFCYEGDDNAIGKGNAFKRMLKNGEDCFKVITFQDFIESLQTKVMDWETRQWTMLLWTRYCAKQLSNNCK